MKRRSDHCSNVELDMVLATTNKLQCTPFDFPSLINDMANCIRGVLFDQYDWATLICLALTCRSEYKLRPSIKNVVSTFLKSVCTAGSIQLHAQFLKGSIFTSSSYILDDSVDTDIYPAAWNNHFEMVKYLHTLKVNRFGSICSDSSLALVGAAHAGNREMVDYFIDLDYELDDLALARIVNSLPLVEIRPFFVRLQHKHIQSGREFRGYSIGTLCFPRLLSVDPDWATKLWREINNGFGVEFTNTVIKTQSADTARSILEPIALRQYKVIGPNTFKVAARTGDIRKMQLVVELNDNRHHNRNTKVPFDVILAAAARGSIELIKYILELPMYGLPILYEPILTLTVLATSGSLETFKWFDQEAVVRFPNYRKFDVAADRVSDYATIMVGAIRSENWDMIHLVDDLGLFNSPNNGNSLAYLAAVNHVDNSVLDWLYDVKELRWSDSGFLGLFNFRIVRSDQTSDRMIEVLKWLIARKFVWSSIDDFYQLMHLDYASKYYKVKTWMMKQPYFKPIFDISIHLFEDPIERLFNFFDTESYQRDPNAHQAHYIRTKFLWLDQI